MNDTPSRSDRGPTRPQMHGEQPATANVLKALFEAKSNFRPAHRSTEGVAGTRRFLYADLPECIEATDPALREAGLILVYAVSPIHELPGGNGVSVPVTGQLIHVETGEVLWAAIEIPLQPYDLNAPGMKAATTAARRTLRVLLLDLPETLDAQPSKLTEETSKRPATKSYSQEPKPGSASWDECWAYIRDRLDGSQDPPEPWARWCHEQDYGWNGEEVECLLHEELGVSAPYMLPPQLEPLVGKVLAAYNTESIRSEYRASKSTGQEQKGGAE